MTERLRWKVEEKLTIIMAIKKNNKVVETCRKYSLDPGMFYKRKESYNTFELEGRKLHYRWAEIGTRKLMKENEKLNKMLAEKELRNALLSESLKKDGKETMNMVNEYIVKRLRISDVADILHLLTCSFCRNTRNSE